MKLSIFGTGYVGLVSGACLAEVGHHVVCMDVDPVKIDKLKAGILPIWEPGLEALVERNVREGRLHFTTDAAQAVQHAQVQFIAVGTPPDEDGSADLQYVLAAARNIARHMSEYKVIVDKSTVPVGTADKVKQVILEELNQRGSLSSSEPQAPSLDPAFAVVSNPEFLKEGAAVNDFLKPDRIIIGTDSERAKAIMLELYEPFNRNHDRTIYMDMRSAELTKYAANAMLATKISFMNEMANLAEHLGADIEQVRRGIGADPRIGFHFIYPGCGYGGSCFPKDVQALTHTARQVGYDAQLMQAVEAVNNRQKTTLFAKLAQHFGGAAELKGKTIAVWGLAFKPNTDDMRAAPSRVLMEALWQAGAKVQAFDPVAMPEAARIYGQNADLIVTDHGANPQRSNNHETSDHRVPQVAAHPEGISFARADKLPSSAISGSAMRTFVREPDRSPQDVVSCDRLHLLLCPDKYAALQNAAALVICTEWQQFRAPDFAEMETRMSSKVIVDGRNLYQPHKLHAEGWVYLSVGRAAL